MNTLTYLLEKYPDKPWNWRWISMNPNITVDFIEKHPDKPWDWEGISMNPNITIDFIEKHIDRLDFMGLSQNKFTYQNKLNRQKEAYILLEMDQSFHKLENLYVVKQYM